MNRENSLQKRLAWLLMGIFACQHGPVVAEPSDHSNTLGELMLLEAQRALTEARRLTRGKDINATDSLQPDEVPADRLIAIYGVGKQLIAQVNAGHTMQFHQSAQLTSTIESSSASPYPIITLSPPCIVLLRNSQRSTLCMEFTSP